jgi:hypothetical protein
MNLPASSAAICKPSDILAAHLLLAGMNYFTMVGTFGSTPPKVIPHELARLICSYLQAA